MDDFIIGGNYQGYTFLGCAQGYMEDEEGRHPYYHIFATCPVSTYKSESYSAYGFKAEKFKCMGPDCWNGLKPGDRVRLFFDDKKRVVMSALDE